LPYQGFRPTADPKRRGGQEPIGGDVASDTSDASTPDLRGSPRAGKSK
jgi:hypothetical protein